MWRSYHATAVNFKEWQSNLVAYYSWAMLRNTILYKKNKSILTPTQLAWKEAIATPKIIQNKRQRNLVEVRDFKV
jgi:hypothetical protein